MLESLFSSQARTRLIILFFSAPGQEYWLREAARVVGMNINAVRREVLRLEEAGILIGIKRGNQRFFQANSAHSFFPELVSLVKKERITVYSNVSQIEIPSSVDHSVSLYQAETWSQQTDRAKARVRLGVCYRVGEL